MAIFHRHQWVTTSATFSPPDGSVESLRGGGPNLYLATLYGMTTVRQECSGCGEVAMRVSPGRADESAVVK